MALADAALSQSVVQAVMIGFFDVLGDPIRVALAPCSIAVPAGMTGDADIDGQVFSALDPQFVEVGPVTHAEGGTDTVTLKLSATIAGDATLLGQLATPANFRGRVGKLWLGLTSGYVPTQLRSYYTGYMAVPEIEGEADGQTIALTLENYLNILSGGAPSRTLLSQRLYDPADASADASAGAANGDTVQGAAATGGLYGRLISERLAG